ncbi:ABC transporter substrate-binding protein [Motilibacter sp. K478]|nr:ABC transporter substrate-binding protein [Motilibacter aurantiacus]
MLLAAGTVGLLLPACTGEPPQLESSWASPAPVEAGGQGHQPEHRGGTLRLVARAAAGTLDPQVNYTPQYWQLFAATYDGLLAFRKVDGEGSLDVVPNLATAMPTVADGGRTYTFELRRGIRFSTGEPVTTRDVVASFRRIFTVSSPTAGTFYAGIVGADACLRKPDTCQLPGVTGDEATRRVTITLVAPDSQFTQKLAVPHASVLPADSPPHDAGTTPLPTTGPYTFSAYDPRRKLELVRNPHFSVWSADAQPEGYPDAIDYTFGLSVQAGITAVLNGDADWSYDPPPADRLPELGSEFAQNVRVNPLMAMWYLAMNTRLAPFDDVRVRQAVNLAVDRGAVAQLYGGSNVASPVCTILPPGFPGHEEHCAYSAGGTRAWTGPDLARGRELVAASGTTGRTVTLLVPDDEVSRSIGEYVRSVLADLGFAARMQPMSADLQTTYIQNTDNAVQVSLTSWYADYPAASDFLDVLFSCASFRPGSNTSINVSGYCDPETDAAMAEAKRAEQSDPGAAHAKWARIDRRVMSAAPVAPLITPKLVDVLSSRVGNYRFSRQSRLLLSQLWVQ